MLERDERLSVELALGRILSMLSRPFQEGDIEEYQRCRGIILDIVGPVQLPWTPNYARDRFAGAQGD